MPFVYKVIFQGVIYGSLWQNIVHFVNDAVTAPQFFEVADEMDAHWVELWRLPQPNNVLWQRVIVSDALNNATAPFVKDIGKAGGQSSDDELHPSLAYTIQKRTNLSGPANRGRMMMPAPWKGDYKSGLIGPAGIQRWATAISGTMVRYGPFHSSDYSLVVKHKGEGFEPVVSMAVSPFPGHVRSRKVGVGL